MNYQDFLNNSSLLLINNNMSEINQRLDEIEYLRDYNILTEDIADNLLLEIEMIELVLRVGLKRVEKQERLIQFKSKGFSIIKGGKQ